jgi:hypothetical protein
MNIQSIHWHNFFKGTICPFLFYGCEKFVKKETKNLAPFADQTVSLTRTLLGGNP